MEKRYSIRDHLLELRKRLTRASIFVALGTGAGFFVAGYIFRALKAEAPGVELVYIELSEYMATYFKISIIVGMALALPFVLYEMVMFVAPALTPREKRFVYILLPAAFVSFLIGAAFAYFVLLPPALKFLLTWGSDVARPQIRISNYVNVVTTLVFWVGIVFEMPLVVTLLAKIGVVTHRFLLRHQRFAIVAAFVAGAAITPTFDPINQALVSVPLVGLYEISIFLAWLVRRKPRQAPEATAPAGEATPSRR